MAAATDRYASWPQLARLREALVSAGLATLEKRMRSGDMDGAAAAIELRYARAERLWNLALEQNPDLRGIALEKRHDLVRVFATLERQRLKDNVTAILANHLAQVPQGAMGEMKVIRGEIGKKRGHIALRRLFERAGTAIQRIKPVLLMSPISVAQFLPPGAISFDLLVIDEASQVRPEDALGAIARASQIVVVGDKKQLPPSSFFDRLLADDNEGDDEDFGPDLLDGAATISRLESILTLCEARGLAGRMLKWHYRSRDPSLIEISNREFYDSDLVLPPSPLQKDPAYGLCFSRVDGVYDKGGKPKQEAEVTLRNALASELSDDGLAAIAAGAKDDGVESSSEPKPDLKLKREARLFAMPAIIAIFARRRPKMISMISYLRVSTTQQGKSGLGLEPHLNLLALTPRLLEAVGASVRPGNVPGVLMDVVRDPLAFDH